MEEIAQVYARALFDVAVERDELDEVREQLDAFADAMHENRDLAVFFFSPYFSVDEKKDALKRALEDVNTAVLNFLEALIERHRMPAIFRIRTDFDAMWEKARHRLPVHVTSAIKLDDATVDELGQADRRADRPQGGGLKRSRSGHPRRRRAQGRKCDPRRLDQEPTRTT